MKTNQSLSDFQTDIAAAVHATFDSKQHINYIWAPLLDTTASTQGSDGGVITASIVHELLTKIMTLWIVLYISGLVIQLVF